MTPRGANPPVGNYCDYGGVRKPEKLTPDFSLPTGEPWVVQRPSRPNSG